VCFVLVCWVVSISAVSNKSLHSTLPSTYYSSSILFRDLKTENVARNHHGAFQLLDFGLAKELKESNRVGELVTDKALSADGSVSFAESVMRSNSTDFDIDDTYKLTGLTGTLRIMSPEVLSCQPYGLSADVYSFGIVLWEVFHGDRNRLSAAEVVKGDRPELPVIGMPPRVDSLIRKCYGSPAFRPTFAMLSQELEYQLLELQQHQDGWQHSAEEALQHICLEQQHQQQANVFRRFDYLRQLSVQPLATTATTTTSAVAAVEN
jgi:serine/threonine protein kinase